MSKLGDYFLGVLAFFAAYSVGVLPPWPGALLTAACLTLAFFLFRHNYAIDLSASDAESLKSSNEILQAQVETCEAGVAELKKELQGLRNTIGLRGAR